MNKIVAVFGLCVFCAVSSFAQGQLAKQVQRGIAQAGFVQKKSLSAVVNGYLRVPGVIHFTLPSGEAMRAVHFSRNIEVTKENLLIPKGSLAVVNPAGKITVYRPDEVVPAEIKTGMDAAFEREHPGFIEFMEALSVPVEEAAEGMPAWAGKPSYDGQIELAQDIDAYYGGKAEEVVFRPVTKEEVRVYRLPSPDIYYHPAGRAGRYLNPEQDLVLFYPAVNRGEIVFGGVTDELWRIFFAPLP